METDPGWRKMGLSRALLDSLFDNPDFTYFEDYIVLNVQFIQSWDLKNTGLDPWVYRKMMVDLFKNYNFTTWETVDPEIREHPCNILLARVGKNTDSQCIRKFATSCLGTC
jgi:acetoin utilization protein AcuA